MVWVVGMVRPARVVRSTAKKCPVTAMFSRENARPAIRPEIPAPPLVLLSSTQPVRPAIRPDKIKAPEEYPGARIWVMFLDVQICQGFHLFKSLL